MYVSNHVAQYYVLVLYLQTCSSVAKERRLQGYNGTRIPSWDKPRATG